MLAVFDGHAGDEVAESAAEALPALAEIYAEAPLTDLFAELSSRLVEHSAGATATIARLRSGELEFGVIGDSPIALLKTDGSFVTGACHNVRTNLEERAAAEARGGSYSRGYLFGDTLHYGLQMSRALGDRFMGAVLSREPEMGSVPVEAGDVLVLATDGVLYEGDDLRHLCEMKSAEAIVADALARGTHDNVSAIRVEF